ncbi:MAG: GAF domain-containing protein [Polyangiales bacterium]
MEGSVSSSLAAQLGVLSDLHEDLDVAVEPQAAARSIVASAIRATSAQAALLAVVRGAYVEVIASQGYDREMLERYGRMPIDAPLPKCRVVQTGQELWLSTPREYAAAFPEFYGASSSLSHTRSTAYVPLISGGVAFGALGVGFGHDTHATHGDAVSLRAIAGFAAVWLRSHIIESGSTSITTRTSRV